MHSDVMEWVLVDGTGMGVDFMALTPIRPFDSGPAETAHQTS